MHTILIKNESDWAAWREPWNELTLSNPMLSHEWLSHWWRVYGVGVHLHIILVVENEQLVGIAPCFVHDGYLGRELRFLGSGVVCSDYLGMVAEPTMAEAVYQCLDEYFRELLITEDADNWLRMRLDGIATTDAWLTRPNSPLAIQTKSIGSTWVTPLPETWDEFKQLRRGKSVLRKIKKVEERLSTGKLSFRMLREPESFAEGLSTFKRLHQLRRTSVGDPGCFADARFEEFISLAIPALMHRSRASFCVCDGEEGPIGVQLLLSSPGTVFMYQSGLDPAASHLEAGHAVCYAAIRDCFETGHRQFDFLRGDEPYKAFWGAVPQPMVEATIAAGSWTAQTICHLDRSLRRFKAWTTHRLASAFAQGAK